MRRLVLLAALPAAGCGAPAPDLFEVERSGRDPNANVRVVVTDNGFVTCNRQEPRPIDGPTLLEARDIARELATQAELAVELPAGENATLRYRVRTETGAVSFSDRSEGRPRVFDRVVGFTARVTEDVCGLQR